MTTHSTPLTPLNDPGQILANLPAIFGFYPQESLVLITFNRIDTSRYRLGPALRLDVDDEEALSSLPQLGEELLAGTEVDLLFAFLITRRPEDLALRGVLDRILPGPEESALIVDACWVVPEVLVGERYRLIFGSAPAGDVMDSWAEGQVADVVGAPAMRPWIEEGILPEVNREEAAARFDRPRPGELVPDPLSAAELRELEAFAGRLAESLCEEKQPQRPQRLAAAAADLYLVLEEISGTGLTQEELISDADLLVVAAVVMAQAELRDIVAASVLAVPAAASELLLAVARRCSGQIRANALSLYALAMVRRGFPMLAAPALQAAQEGMPGHNLSGLLLQTCRHGLSEQMLQCVEQGSRESRRQHGLTVADPVRVVAG